MAAVIALVVVAVVAVVVVVLNIYVYRYYRIYAWSRQRPSRMEEDPQSFDLVFFMT